MRTDGNDSVHPRVDQQRTEQDAYGVTRSEFAGTEGLSKREYFAAMAMQGLLANLKANANAATFSKDAVKLADALIDELNKEVKP